MHAGRLAVASGAARHLVEFYLVEGHVVQHHMADVRDIHALAERAGGDEHQKRVGAEQLLDALALAARQARVVEADERRHLRRVLAQRAGDGHGLLAGVHEHHRLLAGCHQVGQVVVAAGHVAAVVQAQVRAIGGVEHACVDGQLAAHGLGALVVGRGGEREHRGVA